MPDRRLKSDRTLGARSVPGNIPRVIRNCEDRFLSVGGICFCAVIPAGHPRAAFRPPLLPGPRSRPGLNERRLLCGRRGPLLLFSMNLPSHWYDPFVHAAHLGIRVIHRPLPGDLLGLWDALSRTVVLDDELTHAEQRSTLAHELVHAERGDTGPCATDWHTDKQEAAVHGLAARLLIRVEDLSLALLLHDHEIDQAEELQVDVDTLRTRMAGLSEFERGIIGSRVAVARRRPA